MRKLARSQVVSDIALLDPRIDIVPRRIAHRYVVEAHIASGSSGEIYRVLDESTATRVALKRLICSRDHLAAALFEREYHLLRSLRHPLVIEVYDYGVDGAPYYTMELLEGADLSRSSAMEANDAGHYLRDVAVSLAWLHSRRLIHRDVSPKNVRISVSDRCKLLDFGALATFGIADRIVGTPPCVPPEALRGQPLDQRSDLYGLGAVAYRLLTGRHAYPARRLADLEDIWKKPLPPPSQLAPNVPDRLDELVLSLLSDDPNERPAHALEVVARLTTCLGLGPDDRAKELRARLAAPRLCGRDAQRTVLDRVVREARRGRRRSVRITGESGAGLSRMLSELGLSARFAGFMVATADAEVARGALGVVDEIAFRLLNDAPDIARKMAGPYAVTLASISPRIAACLDVREPSQRTDAEQGPAIQEALQQWVFDLARERPLLIGVDNAQRLSQASAAFVLGALLDDRACSLVLALTCSERHNTSRSSLRRFDEHALHVSLGALGTEDTIEMCRSLFGTGPNVVRFGQWLAVLSGGNVSRAVELAQRAVDTGAVRFEHGEWMLPRNPFEAITRLDGDPALDVLSRLGHDARELARTLSVHRGAFTLDTCLALGHSTPVRVHEALAVLVQEGILVARSYEYFFRQSTLRESLESSLDPVMRRRCHDAIGNALLKTRQDARAKLDAAWHLLRGTQEERGAALLLRIADHKKHYALLDVDVRSAVPGFEAALRVFERTGRSDYDKLPLLSALVDAGFYEDHRIARKYGDRAINTAMKAAGLTAARKLRPFLGRRASLAIGVTSARARHALARTDDDFRVVITHLLAGTTIMSAVATTCFDQAGARRYAALLEPFAALNEKSIAAAMYDYCGNLLLVDSDQFGRAENRWKSLLERFRNPTYFRELPENTRQRFLGGIYYALGVLAARRDDGSVLECARILDGLGIRFYRTIATRLRINHHAHRGEMDRVEELRRKQELQSTQAGSTWQEEVWEALGLGIAHAHQCDATGLTRATDAVTKLSREIPSLRRFRRLLVGMSLSARGENLSAVALFEDLLRHAEPRSFLGWALSHATCARALNELGKHAQARQVCENALAHLTSEDTHAVVIVGPLEQELAIAEARLGHIRLAADRLDALIVKYSDRGPVTRSRFHAARAAVAAAAKDEQTFRTQVRAMEMAVRPTNNAALLAQWKRLKHAADAPNSFGATSGLPRWSVYSVMRTPLRSAGRVFPPQTDDADTDVTATETMYQT